MSSVANASAIAHSARSNWKDLMSGCVVVAQGFKLYEIVASSHGHLMTKPGLEQGWLNFGSYEVSKKENFTIEWWKWSNYLMGHSLQQRSLVNQNYSYLFLFSPVTKYALHIYCVCMYLQPCTVVLPLYFHGPEYDTTIHFLGHDLLTTCRP